MRAVIEAVVLRRIWWASVFRRILRGCDLKRLELQILAVFGSLNYVLFFWLLIINYISM